jgi:uncharacterized protein
MTSLKQIEDFLTSGPIALVGVSRNPKKFGYAVFKELKEKGLKIIPVNPQATEILGEKVYRNVKELPSEVKGIIIMTRKGEALSIVKEAKEKGIKQIWFQQQTDSREALEELKNSDINFIAGECILMYYKPHSVHKFHRGLKKLFGRFPK